MRACVTLRATQGPAKGREFPFDLGSVGDPCVAVLKDKVIPIRARGLSLPGKVADVIDKALALDWKDRYPSAKEFSDALSAAIGGA